MVGEKLLLFYELFILKHANLYLNLLHKSLNFSDSLVPEQSDSENITVEYQVSQKGTMQLVVDGYPYTRHAAERHILYWRCVQFRPLG